MYEYWQTKDGKIVKISEMSDTHLLNAINFLKRRVKEFSSIPYPCFQGEMAQTISEQEYDTAEEIREDMGVMIISLEAEMKKRQRVERG